jgi:hypothetical protein
MKVSRLLVSTLFVTSSLLQAWFAGIAWGLDTRAGGALAMVLLGLALLLAAGAVWQYMLGVGMKTSDPDNEVLLLSVLFFLQIVPISIIFGLASQPVVAASLALLLGLVPIACSVIYEQSKQAPEDLA